MAGDLDFSVQLRLLNENFNNGINQARDKFTQYAQSVQRNLDQMGADTERAETLLTGLGNVSSDRLTAEIRAASDQLRQMGAGANITREQLDTAMQSAAQHVAGLENSFEQARLEAERLGRTDGTPAQLAEATAQTNRLETELRDARLEAERLGSTNGSPAQILQATQQVSNLEAELTEARLEASRLAQTNATPAQLAEAANRVNTLEQGLLGARTEATRLSQTNGTPAQIEQANAKVNTLGATLTAARLEAERLGRTNASPEQIAEAAANVNRLEQELNEARSASTSLSNELSGAMNRASASTDNARNALYRMANIRVPETIRGEINSISRALVDFQRNSGRPAAEIERATRAAQAEIRRLENELNGLDETQERVSQGSGGLGGNINRLRGAFGSLQGLLAAAGLGIGVAEIIQTADAFKTLEARVKLATGEGASFVSGFEGVKRIANETFSSVENTGELFSRISQAAESLGLAQTEVLSVTRTINEAIKLSGGSAASADAAITQLIQGLQSGVVRGDEFNSIMEQSPRLAKAMADGLGVTRGELRAMAADGKLSSEVVIGAIQSQGAAIASEFETLPTTVGNSLQVLKNKLFNFVGEIDGSLNQTSKLAEAIDYIGDNLEDLDPSFIAALTGAFENTIEAVVTVGKRIKETYDNINSVINMIAGGSADAAEQVGIITASLHGVSIFIGAISDGIKGLAIAGDLFTAVILEWAAAATRFYASLTFGKGKQAILELAEALDEGATKAFDRANAKAMDFESSTEKALVNAAKGAKERFEEIAAESEKMYNEMIADSDATAEAIEGQLVKMVADRIRANDMILSDSDRLLLASKGLQAEIGKEGEVAIVSAKKTQAAYLGVGESFAEVALKAKESGKSIELSLTEAISKANTKGAVDDIVLSLNAMANQGLITGKQLELGANIAKTRYEEVDKQLQQNIERFAEYAVEQIKSTNGVVTAELQRAAALEGLAVQATETGGVLVTQLDESTLASERTKQQIDELAGSVGVGLSKEFIKSSEGLNELIDGFDDLEKAGYDAGGALVNSLTEMTNKASNTAELEYVIEQWRELGKEGKLTGQELADGLDLSRTKLDELTDGINSVAEAYGVLGLKTREELAKQAGAFTESYDIITKDGQATAQQLEEAFEKTAKANIASNNGIIDAVTARMAAERDVTIAIDEQGRVSFEKAGQTVSANNRVKTSVDRVRTSHDNLASSAGVAGNEMVRAASRAFTAYDKLQKKIKDAKEAMELKNADETLKNLRVYGTEKAPVEGNQFGSKTAVEGFLKSAGLTAERAAEEARKLYAKQGTSGGALNAGALQGIKDGQFMTPQQLANFKTASALLLEVAEKAKADEARRSKYEDKLDRNRERYENSQGSQNGSQSNSVDPNPTTKIVLTKENASQHGYVWDDEKGGVNFGDEFDRLRQAFEVDKSRRESGVPESGITSYQKELAKITNSQPQPVLPQAALDAMANLNKQPNFDPSKNTGPVKTIVVELKSAAGTVEATIPESQEALFAAFVKQLQDSKALSGN